MLNYSYRFLMDNAGLLLVKLLWKLVLSVKSAH
nr:MAG TPA: hypothetical protein [Caudoviricetes sp.]